MKNDQYGSYESYYMDQKKNSNKIWKFRIENEILSKVIGPLSSTHASVQHISSTQKGHSFSAEKTLSLTQKTGVRTDPFDVFTDGFEGLKGVTLVLN